MIAGAFSAPGALGATEVQRADEAIYLRLPGAYGFKVAAALYPDRGAAVLWTIKGESRRSRSLGVAYAVAAPTTDFAGGIDVRFGSLGEIRGHFVATEAPHRESNDRACRGRRPVRELGRFVGRLRFRGSGGYLAVGAKRATAYVSRSFRLLCEHGHAERFEHPGSNLFRYVEPPTWGFFNSDGTRLASVISTKRRVTEFVAMHPRLGEGSSFQAATLEWLPGGVATVRWVEVNRVADALFTTSLPERHPESARVEPPAPFLGSAKFARKSHSLTGELSVALPGLEARLADRRTKAGLCIFTAEMLDRVCE